MLGVDIGGSAVKAAAWVGGAWSLGASRRYTSPDRDTLIRAVGEAVAAAVEGVCGSAPEFSSGGGGAIGVCCPGLVDPVTLVVQRAVNLPAIEGLSVRAVVEAGLLSAREAGIGGHAAGNAPPIMLTSDAHAAALDIQQAERLSGRLLAVSVGTGVGACVLDGLEPLHVSGATPGHLGHIDVWQPGDGAAPVGRDGARGTLEAMCGLAAWQRAAASAGCTAEEAIEHATVASLPVVALIRALRIAHAIYRPHHVRLLGGVGIRLRGAAPALRAAIADGLTSLAREGWTLGCGTDDHHAARGAARAAGSTTS